VASVFAFAVLLSATVMGSDAPSSGRAAMMSPQFNPVVVGNGLVYAANTPGNSVDVFESDSGRLIRRISVGIEPVGLALRPDRTELWVANHVSDSVSVIDLQNSGNTRFQVVHTIQEIDPATRSTLFDEPVGIVFADNDKAYVSLSSENQIAVIDATTRKILRRLKIPAQEPRGMAVRNERLYVLAFESNNQTQLSGGKKEDIDGDLVTFDAWEHSIHNNNVLSIGHTIDIVKNPKVPDRDLFIFDTDNDELIDTVSTIGTLLYGITVDSTERVYIAQTDARNDVNGKAGTRKHGLAELENRPFLNRIATVSRLGTKTSVSQIDLEPLPPEHPTPDTAQATPCAVQVSDDDQYLYLTAAGSDAFSILQAATGKCVGRCNVGAVPQGLSIEYKNGQPSAAWVLNAAANSLSKIDISNPNKPLVQSTIPLEDPTDEVVKRGRIAFSTARASTTGTFSCASCHPDGHTDQLLWVLATPVVTGANQIMPRSTMPVRGLRDTAPFHWDGIPGDPYGGIHSASIHKDVKPNSSIGSPESTTRNLIDGGLASTMARVGDSTKNDEGKPGLLTARERDDMSVFLLNVPYPPAQRRAYDNRLSTAAEQGFRLFHVDGDLDPGKPRPNVCGDCHRMPHWVSTNTPGTGMDAPTWHGAYDRWLILPQGRLNIIDFDFFERIIQQGAPERSIWQMSWGGRARFNQVWDMVLEGSTGFPGAFARQTTLNRLTAGDMLTRRLTEALLEAAQQGTVSLQGCGVRISESSVQECKVSVAGPKGNELQIEAGGHTQSVTCHELFELAERGELLLTLTACLGTRAQAQYPQPVLWTSGNLHQQRGRQVFPIMTAESRLLELSGRYLSEDALVFVDGCRVGGNLELAEGDSIRIRLETAPKPGMHFLQVQLPQGFISNDFIFHVAKDQATAQKLRESLDEPHSESGAIRRALSNPASINSQMHNGSTPLAQAALWGQLSLVHELLKNGANVNVANGDGNTPLHLAAFMCHREVVMLLLEHGADADQKNNRGETPLDVVNGEWSAGLAEFYQQLGVSLGLPVDTRFLERMRPEITLLLSRTKK
jgi:DNA-binding beta-propeller fold protein YncE